MKYFLLGLALLSLQSFAGIVPKSACSDTDIRESNPKIRQNPELKAYFSTPKNQDSIGWCYAFTAADLISAEVGTPVSSLHASIQYNQYTESHFIYRKVMEHDRKVDPDLAFQTVYEGGNAEKAIAIISQNKSICPERDLPFDVQKSGQVKAFIAKLEELKKLQDGKDLICQTLTSSFPGIKDSDFDLQKVSGALLQQNLNLSLADFAAEKCKGKMIPVPKLRVKKISAGKDGEFLKIMNGKLDQGRPLGLDYEVKTFSDNLEGSHASVIIGRRWKNDHCEYNIRNSWGKTCNNYKKSVDCIKDEGSFWASDADLLHSAENIEYIDN